MKQFFSEEVKKIRVMSAKEKREYIWEYYKIHIISTIIILVIAGSIAYETVINPPPTPVLTIAWVAGFEPPQNFETLEEFLNPKIIQNPSAETINAIPFSFDFVNNAALAVANQQRLVAMIAVREIDIVIGSFAEADAESEELSTLGMVPALGFTDILPYLENTDMHDLLSYEGETIAVSVANSVVLQEMGFNTENLYLGIMSNSLKEEAIRTAVKALVGNQI